LEEYEREMDEEGLEFGGAYVRGGASKQAQRRGEAIHQLGLLVADCGAAGLGLGPRRTKAERANPRVVDLVGRGGEGKH